MASTVRVVRGWRARLEEEAQSMRDAVHASKKRNLTRSERKQLWEAHLQEGERDVTAYRGAVARLSSVGASRGVCDRMVEMRNRLQRLRYAEDESYRETKRARVTEARERDREAFRAKRRQAYALKPDSQRRRSIERYASLSFEEKQRENELASERRRQRKAAWTEERWEQERQKRRERRRRQSANGVG